MYRSRLWTMRQFVGFGTAEDTNGRFKELLRAGGGRASSTAFDMPTLLGRDSDDPWARGEVGRAGVAVDTVVDMETLFAGIDLSQVSTSMTINSPAAPIFAMYISVADQTGVERKALSGTLAERHLEGISGPEGVRLSAARPSVRLVTDVMRFCAAELPRWHPVSVSGYHIREQARAPPKSSPSRWRTGSPTSRRRWPRAPPSTTSRRGSASSSTPTSISSRRSPSTAPHVASGHAGIRDRYGAADGRSTQLRFHTQTAGVSLTAQQPEVNLVRVAIEALAGVLGGTQSLHTDAFDEALALPTEHAARLALRTQQVIAEESGVVHVADPLGGSWFVEELTDELEHQAEEVFAHLEDAGSGSMLQGVFACIDNGWFVSEIADAAYGFQSKIAKGEWVQVGVNGYVEDDGVAPSTLSIGPGVETSQLERLAAVKQSRDDDAVRRSLARIASEAADPTINLMPALIEAARGHVTVGEAMGALESVFGLFYERHVA